jgi:3-oxoacyl-[acyl-carrier protein] reductase
MDLQLQNRRVVITGASRGIGRAIASTLAREGARVALCARGADGVQAAVEALRGYGAPDAFGVALDVRQPGQLEDFVREAAQRWGGLDTVVSNVSTRPEAEGTARWSQSFEADLLQHVRLAEAAVPYLGVAPTRAADAEEPAAAASLVFVASIAASMTQLLPEEVAYGAFKASLVHYAAALAERLGPRGVRVNTVSPGPIDFPGGAWDHYRRHKPRLVEAVTRMSALGRLGHPDDVARAVAFLASPAAGYITGANLRIDGGTVKSPHF